MAGKSNTVGYTESAEFMCLEDLGCVGQLEILEPLSLRYCGREQCRSGHRFGPFVRENYLIHVVISGRGTYRIGKGSWEVGENQAFLIRPGEETVYQADSRDPWQYAWFAFRGYRAEELTKMMGFTKECPVIPAGNAEMISSLIGGILKTREITAANDLKRRSLFYAVLTAMTEGNSQAQKPREDMDAGSEYVRMAVEEILKSYRGKVRIGDIADRIGINRSYLTNLFRQKMNMSPQEFLINFRLEKAAQLLRETNDPICWVAENTGYADSLAFSKAFRQKYRMTPSSYRTERPMLSEYGEKGGYTGAYPL